MNRHDSFERSGSRALRLSCFLFLLILPIRAHAQFNFLTNGDNTLTITQYNGGAGIDVVIPDATNGIPIVAIGDEAFFSADVNSISFPSGLKSIGEGAFANNFHWTAAVVLPAGLTNIGGGAFGATEVSSVSIPASAMTIEDGAFANGYGLTSITVDPSNPNYLSSAEGVLFNHDQTRLLTYPAGRAGSYVIPATVGDLAPDAFSGVLHLPTIAVPDSVTNIEDFAFGNSQNLRTIKIGANVKSIGFGVFQTAFNVVGIYFRGNAPTYGGIDFSSGTKAIVYYLPGTAGWTPFFDTAPTELWNPQAINPRQSNQFGFDITGSTNLIMAVEASTNLSNPNWVGLTQITLTPQGTGHFDDVDSTNYPVRFYRLTAP